MDLILLGLNDGEVEEVSVLLGRGEHDWEHGRMELIVDLQLTYGEFCSLEEVADRDAACDLRERQVQYFLRGRIRYSLLLEKSAWQKRERDEEVLAGRRR